MYNLLLLLLGVLLIVVSTVMALLTGSHVFMVPSFIGGVLVGYNAVALWFS